METPKVSQMWLALQRAHKLPRTDVLSGAEEELQELMRQIDIMVQTRKLDWEKEKVSLMAKLDIKDKEQHIQKSTLDQKHKEIGNLRAQLETVEESQRKVTAEYENQLGTLRDEIAGMKKEFEKLHRRYTKKTQQAEADQQRSSSDTQETAAEVKRLNTKLEEYKRRAKDWDQKRRRYDQQIEELQKIMQAVQEKQQLGQDSEKLQTTLDEALLSNKILSDDKHELQASLGQTHVELKKLEEELEHLRSQNQLAQQHRMDQQKLIEKLQETIKQKDNMIKDLHNRPVQDVDSVQKLEADLQCIREELRRSHESKSHHHDQTKSLLKQLDEVCGERDQIAAQLQNKSRDFTEQEQDQSQQHSFEISKLKADQATQEESHKAVMEGMKKEMAAVATELHQKSVAMTALSEKLVANEKQIHEYADLSDKKQAALQVAQAQLDALRLENRHLRNKALSQDGTDVDLSDTERHLKELQNAYSKSVASLESQNERLQADLGLLKERLVIIEKEHRDRLTQSLSESQRTIQTLQHREHKKIHEIEDKAKKQIRELEEALNSQMDHYENQVSGLRLDISTLHDERDIQNHSLRRLGMEHDVMTKFVNGVDHMIQGPAQEANGNHGNQDGRSSSARDYSLEIDEELEDDYLTDTVETATTKFLQDQEERSKLLEEQLDSHIHYLKAATDDTIRKYLVKSH